MLFVFLFCFFFASVKLYCIYDSDLRFVCSMTMRKMMVAGFLVCCDGFKLLFGDGFAAKRNQPYHLFINNNTNAYINQHMGASLYREHTNTIYVDVNCFCYMRACEFYVCVFVGVLLP